MSRADTTRRVRRSAEEARRVILDAAERRLREGGPEALRLRDVADDVGISHPAILHHFASRDGLARALRDRAMTRLENDLLEALEGGTGRTARADLLDRVFETLGDSGHARLLAWYALSDPEPEDVPREGMLAELTEALHERRAQRARERGQGAPEREDTAFVVRLIAVALIGDALCGRILDRSLGAEHEALQRRFRAWLAERVAEHVARPARG